MSEEHYFTADPSTPFTRVPVRAALLLHPGLVQVPTAVRERVAGLLLQLAEQRPVRVVVLLDDLEGPPALDHVAADQLALDPVGRRGVAGLAQLAEPGRWRTSTSPATVIRAPSRPVRRAAQGRMRRPSRSPRRKARGCGRKERPLER